MADIVIIASNIHGHIYCCGIRIGNINLDSANTDIVCNITSYVDKPSRGLRVTVILDI